MNDKDAAGIVDSLRRIADALDGSGVEESIELDARFQNGQPVQVQDVGTDELGHGYNGRVGTVVALFWQQEMGQDAVESFRVRFEDGTEWIFLSENLRAA